MAVPGLDRGTPLLVEKSFTGLAKTVDRPRQFIKSNSARNTSPHRISSVFAAAPAVPSAASSPRPTTPSPLVHPDASREISLTKYFGGARRHSATAGAESTAVAPTFASTSVRPAGLRKFHKSLSEPTFGVVSPARTPDTAKPPPSPTSFYVRSGTTASPSAGPFRRQSVQHRNSESILFPPTPRSQRPTAVAAELAAPDDATVRARYQSITKDVSQMARYKDTMRKHQETAEPLGLKPGKRVVPPALQPPTLGGTALASSRLSRVSPAPPPRVPLIAPYQTSITASATAKA